MQNAECKMQNDGASAPAGFADLAVHIRVDKAGGERTGRCVADGRNSTEDVYGAAVLIQHIARKYQAPVEQVLAKLATVLLTQERTDPSGPLRSAQDDKEGT